MKKRFTIPTFVAVAVAIASVAQAANPFEGPPGVTTLPSPLKNLNTDVPNLICTITGWLFWGLIVLSIIMALMGAYRYLTSAGEPEKVSKANKTLLFAAIAVVIGIIAGGFPSLVGSFFPGSLGLGVGVCSLI